VTLWSLILLAAEELMDLKTKWVTERIIQSYHEWIVDLQWSTTAN
jgi:hypothetical protein